MNKAIVFLMLGFGFNAYAFGVKVVSFDKRAGTVTLEGGKFYGESTYQKHAEEYCQGPATLIAGGQVSIGTYSTGNSFSATTVDLKKNQRLFKCGDAQAQAEKGH